MKQKVQELPALIGLGGLPGAGKDVVADYLVERHGYVKIGMSDALANALYTLNPMVPDTRILPGRTRPAPVQCVRYRDYVDGVGYVRAKENPEVRRLLQVLGTDVGRDLISKNVWVDMTARVIDEYAVSGKNVVVTGIRFENEVIMLDPDEPDVVTWWIERPGVEPTAHSSDAGVDKYSFQQVLTNATTKEALYSKVEQALADYQSSMTRRVSVWEASYLS